MSKPSVCVIVLTFNQCDLTRECLRALYASDAAQTRVLVVDNGSTDKTIEMVTSEFPHVRLIENDANLGYAEGNNVGLRDAMAQGADFAIVLNNDVVVAPDWVEHLINAAENDTHAAFVGPMVYHANEPNVIQSAGGILPKDWHAYHRAANELEHGQFQSVDAVDWLNGCAIMARCGALDEIGLLDAQFFMYGEEVDWCVRAREKHYSVLFAPRARVWHSGVQRDYSPPPRVTYYSARNELQLIQKHRGGTKPLALAFARHLRTVVSWSVRPKWRTRQAHRDALILAMHDFLRGIKGARVGF